MENRSDIMGYLGREVAEEPQWLPPVGQRGNPLYGPGHGEEVPDEEGAPQGEVEAAPGYGAFTSQGAPKGCRPRGFSPHSRVRVVGCSQGILDHAVQRP